jgi:CheY-like chemotaxis protein
MDGYTATRRIKADPALRSIPIIAVTSYALSGEEKTARAAGCDDYVPKPYSPRQLLAKIRVPRSGQPTVATVETLAGAAIRPTNMLRSQVRRSGQPTC